MSTTVTITKVVEAANPSKKGTLKTPGVPGVSKLEKDAITYAARVVYEKFMILLEGFKLEQAAQHRMLAGLAEFFSLSSDFMSELKALIAEDDKEVLDKMLKNIRKKFEIFPDTWQQKQPFYLKIRQDWNLWMASSPKVLATQLKKLSQKQQQKVKSKWQTIFNRVLVIDLLGFMEHPVTALNPFRMLPKKKDDLTEETLRAQFATNAVFAMVQALTDEGLALKPSDVRRLAREFDTQISKARKQQEIAFRNNRQDFSVQSAELISAVLHQAAFDVPGGVVDSSQHTLKPLGRVPGQQVLGNTQRQPKNPTAPKSGGPSVGKVHPNAKPSPSALGGAPKKPKPQSKMRKPVGQASNSNRVQIKSNAAEKQRAEQKINKTATTIIQFVTRPAPKPF